MVCLKKNLYGYEAVFYFIIGYDFFRVSEEYGAECQVVYGKEI